MSLGSRVQGSGFRSQGFSRVLYVSDGNYIGDCERTGQLLVGLGIQAEDRSLGLRFWKGVESRITTTSILKGSQKGMDKMETAIYGFVGHQRKHRVLQTCTGATLYKL